MSDLRPHATRLMTIAIAAQLVSGSVSAVTLDNSGFESPNVGADTFYAFQYGPIGYGWDFPAGSGIAGNSSGFTAGNPTAPEGIQVAFVQMNGSMSQDFTVGAPTTLSFSFLAAQRATGTVSGPLPNIQDFDVYIDAVHVGYFFPTTTTYQTYSTAPVSLFAGSHTLSFLGRNTDGRDNTVLIDAVSAVPEPGIGVLIVAGSVILLLSARRREGTHASGGAGDV